MSTSGQELEVKFYLADLKSVEARLVALGAQLAQPRVHETNLRFDTPDGSLARSFQVLRLRQDTLARVTYKGPGELQDGVRIRRELEFVASDFAMAQALFEALGYQVTMMYEKYRVTYTLGEVMVTLDEMPYGNFIEIEGPDGASIRSVSDQLGMNWDGRILDSYLMMFERARASLGLTCQDLSFANFAGVNVPPQALGVLPSAPSISPLGS